MKFEIKYGNCRTTKWTWKYHLYNGSHFLSASMCWYKSMGLCLVELPLDAKFHKECNSIRSFSKTDPSFYLW